MKTVFVFMSVFFGSVYTYAQTFAVQAEKMNIVYTGLPNPITIVAEGYSCDQLVLTCTEGTLEKTSDNCHYHFNPVKPGVVEFTVAAKTKGGLKRIGYSRYRVKTLPNPRVAIAGKSGGKITASVFKQQQGISMIFDHCEYEIKGAVTSFRIIFLYAGGTTAYEAENSGANFSPEIRQEMKKLKPGDKIIAENIKGVFADGRILPFNSIMFTLQ